MSTILSPKYAQPVDFIKEDHSELVRKLRRYELKIALRRQELWEGWTSDNRYKEKHPDYDIDGRREKYNFYKLLDMNNQLLDLYYILQFYYEYPSDWYQTLADNKAIRWKFFDGKIYDAFWCPQDNNRPQ